MMFTSVQVKKLLIEKQTGRQIKRFRTDNSMKFCDGEFDEFCKNEEIILHCTVKMMSQQNSMTEYMNRTHLERARYMITNTGLTKDF